MQTLKWDSVILKSNLWHSKDKSLYKSLILCILSLLIPNSPEQGRGKVIV